MALPVTLAIAAACALINLWLGIRISQRRIGAKIPLGDGGDPVMIARGRAHANFVEYAPFVLILIAVIELARGPTAMLWAAGAVFVVARLIHPIGMDRAAPNPFRMGAIMATWIVLIGLAGWAAVIAYQTERNPPPAVAEPIDTIVPSA